MGGTLFTAAKSDMERRIIRVERRAVEGSEAAWRYCWMQVRTWVAEVDMGSAKSIG